MAKNKHRRERLARELKRKKESQSPFPRVLIVCEGEKTEPLYFDDIRKQNRVPTAHIRVLPANGTQPRQVVDFAEATFRESKEYEWVFAVFDRDAHTTYLDALNRAAALDEKLKNNDGQKVRVIAVPSVPCFELWLLLHFIEIHAFSHRHEIIQRVATHIAGYEKGLEGVYAATEPMLALAMERARRLKHRFDPRQGDDPVTLVHEVVELLRSIRPSR
ncbi:MAG TPA: RloB domain-containing protein [Hyphomonadaceae bacterium]|nr:RloB domain-containing protein [Hyphomonadaceae bacterium]